MSEESQVAKHDSNFIGVEDLKKAFPKRKGAVTQELVDIINATTAEPEFQGESLMQSAATYENVMSQGKVSLGEYINGLKFCAYLVSTKDNNTEAYKKTFMYRDFVKERMYEPSSSSGYADLTSAASRYRRSKLVTDILTISQVPLDMMFTGHRYKAVGILAQVMSNAKLDRDKINAAKELLAATAGSDKMKIALEVGPSAEAVDMQETLNSQLAALALNQQRMLASGMDLTDVQKTQVNLNIIEGEVVDE